MRGNQAELRAAELGATAIVLEKQPQVPLDRTLSIAIQISRALARAHDLEVIHRDLKPENIFVTADGRVKILDFGLARQIEPGASVESETSDGRTMLGKTEPGMVMGTVGYMSPEQVSGRPADHRSDIFSLGCVLYEMAAGQRVFRRNTAAETMTAILREDPPELPRDSTVRPAAFEGTVRHCLEKRPDERFQSARDLAFALRSLLGSSSGGQAVAASRSRLPRPAVAGLLALGAVVIFLAGWYTAARDVTVRTAPQVVAFAQVTDQPGDETTPSLSPDGKSVVYVKTVGSDTDLYLLRIGGRNAVRLTPDSPADDLQPAFSPDGERIAFRSERDGGGVFLMSATGESVTRLTSLGYSPSWSPDGAEIVVAAGTFTDPTAVFNNATGLSVVNVSSGRSRPLATTIRALQPSWSPDGARIAFWGLRGQSGQKDIWTVAANGSDAAQDGVSVTDDAAFDWSPTWSPDGRYLYFSSARGGTINLWRVAIEERSGRVLSKPEPVTTPSTWSGYLSFSRDGSRLAFSSLDYRSTLLRVPFDPAREVVTGPPVPVLKGTRPIRDHELSPDGNWIAFTEAGVREDLFIARVDGTQYRRLTDDEFRDRGPAWAPDGSRLAFYADRSGGYDVWTIKPDGSALAQLTRGTGVPGFPVWSPDGATVAFGRERWYLVDTTTLAPTLPAAAAVISETERFRPASWSAVGGRIAGQVLTVDGGDVTLAVYTVSNRQFARVPGEWAHRSHWLWPVWLANGRRFIIRRPEGIAIADADTGAGRMLFFVGGNIIGRSVGITRDNRWITYTETANEGDVWVATIADR
jgi:Tol biopolymer transport system component